MENDVLKNKIAPWQEKGRWYHGVVNTASNTLVSDETDKFINDNCSLLANAGTMFIGFSGNFGDDSTYYNILDLKSLNSGLTNSMGSGATIPYMYYRNNGNAYFPLYTGYATAGIVEFWIFVVRYERNK